jgi:O-antigen/teichoic acid export membrane protein
LARKTEIYDVPKGAAYLTSQQFIVYATYFLFYVALARLLSTFEVGLVALLALVQALFTVVASGSLPSAATRFISRSLGAGDLREAGGVAKTTLRMSIAFALPGLAIAVLLSPSLGGFIRGASDPTGLLLVTFIAAFLIDIISLYASFFFGVGRYALTLYQNVAYVLLSRGLGLALAYLGFRVLGIVAGWAIAGATTIILSLFFWHGRLPKGGSYPIRPLITFSLPVYASALIMVSQQWGDIGIIYALLGPAILGPYYVVVSSVNFLSAFWIPVNQAIYPALSASHSTGEVNAVSEKLAVAFRLTNLAVLPIGAALAAITPTVLDIVYGPRYANQALAFSILSLASVFTAQGALLVTTLQAVGRTRQYLKVTLASTLIYLFIVSLSVIPIGTLAGAIGRAGLAISIVVLARRSLHNTVSAHTNAAIFKAIPLALGVAAPIFIVNLYFLTYHPLNLRPIFQLLVLFGIFVLAYGAVSRRLRVFHHGDFAILHGALPRRFQPYLRMIQRLVISDKQD